MDKIDERDQLRLASHVAKVSAAKAEAELAKYAMASKQNVAAKRMDELGALMKELRERYKLGEQDAVDTETGEITRAPLTPPAPSLPPDAVGAAPVASPAQPQPDTTTPTTPAGS